MTRIRQRDNDKPPPSPPCKLNSVSGLFALIMGVAALFQFGMLHNTQGHLPSNNAWSSLPVDVSFHLKTTTTTNRKLDHGKQEEGTQRRRRQEETPKQNVKVAAKNESPKNNNKKKDPVRQAPDKGKTENGPPAAAKAAPPPPPGKNLPPSALRLPTPIIVLGLPKAGGTTIHEFFKCGLDDDSADKISHYDCKPGKDPDKIGMSCGKHMRRNLEKAHQPAFADMDQFHVYTQLDAHEKKGGITLPQWSYLQEIHDNFPSATWILNTRNAKSWVKALDGWGDLRQRLVDHHIYPEFPAGVGTVDIDMVIFAQMQAARVKEFVDHHPSHHLVEVKIDSPDAGNIMEEAFGISKECWVYRKHDKKPVVEKVDDTSNTQPIVLPDAPGAPAAKLSTPDEKEDTKSHSVALPDAPKNPAAKPSSPGDKEDTKSEAIALPDPPRGPAAKPKSPPARQVYKAGDVKLPKFHKDIDLKPNELKLPTPIIVMGLPKAGTTSISGFFECGLDLNVSRISHYDCKPGKDPEKIGMSCGKKMRRNLEKAHESAFFGIDNFDVYAELDAYEKKGGITLPQWAYLQEIHDHFPNSTWILNSRDEHAWIKSLNHWRDLRQRFIDHHIYPEFPHGVGAKDADMIAFSHLQAQRVREFVEKHPSHRLVEVKIDTEDAGIIMEEAFGITQKCWGQKNVNKNHTIEATSDFQKDPLCGGCRSILMDHLERGLHRERCGIKIYKDAKEQNITILEAARLLVQNPVYGADCLPCLQCEDADRHYWRYDKAAAPFQNPKTYYFASVPEEHRIPNAVLADSPMKLTKYFLKQNAVAHNRPKQYLFEYNPSIVKLPSYMSFPNLEKEHGKIAYVASFRLATQQSCFDVADTLQMIGGSWDVERRPEKKDYLGLALMREDLSVVAEAVVDLPRRFRKREDFRLFLLRGQLYVSSYCKLTPLWIKEASDKKRDFSLSFDSKREVETWQATNVFPAPLRAWIGADITQCASEQVDNMHFKNLNYVVSPSGDTLIDLYPLSPHVVRPLPHVLDASAPTPNKTSDISDNVTALRPSYYTVDELVLANEMDFFEMSFTQDRGGACCVPIVNPREPSQTLWLGISHIKTPHGRKKLEKRLPPNQYLSRWHAFEQTPPYRTVAMSGGFCWPLPKPSNGTAFNPLVPHSGPFNRFTMGSLKHINCPVIHFVSGMVEKVGDPDTLILSMGVADCTPWFLEVKKEDIVERLFNGPPMKGVYR